MLPPDEGHISPVAQALADALAEAFSLARGERLAELRGEAKYRKTFDARGLHPFSLAWGKVELLRAMLPDVVEHEEPFQLRDRARLEADAQFRREIIESAERAA